VLARGSSYHNAVLANGILSWCRPHRHGERIIVRHRRLPYVAGPTNGLYVARPNVIICGGPQGRAPLIRDFINELENAPISMKGPADCTSATTRTDNILSAEWSKARPGYCCLVEEAARSPGDKSHRFISAPIDGPTNFNARHPHFAIAIGFGARRPAWCPACLYPVTDDLYTPRKAWRLSQHKRLARRRPQELGPR